MSKKNTETKEIIGIWIEPVAKYNPLQPNEQIYITRAGFASQKREGVFVVIPNFQSTEYIRMLGRKLGNPLGEIRLLENAPGKKIVLTDFFPFGFPTNHFKSNKFPLQKTIGSNFAESAIVCGLLKDISEHFPQDFRIVFSRELERKTIKTLGSMGLLSDWPYPITNAREISGDYIAKWLRNRKNPGKPRLAPPKSPRGIRERRFPRQR